MCVAGLHCFYSREMSQNDFRMAGRCALVGADDVLCAPDQSSLPPSDQ